MEENPLLARVLAAGLIRARFFPATTALATIDPQGRMAGLEAGGRT